MYVKLITLLTLFKGPMYWAPLFRGVIFDPNHFSSSKRIYLESATQLLCSSVEIVEAK